MEDEIFFNEPKYIKEMLKKFGLEDSKPTKTPMSMEIKLTKDNEADSVDSSKYQEYLPRIHRTRRMDEDLRESYRTLEKCLFHEEDSSLHPSLKQTICFHPFKPLEVKRDEEEHPYIEFKLGQFTFKLTSSQLSLILQTPYALNTFNISEGSLNSLDDHPNSNFFGPKHDLIKNNITIYRTTQT
uniref:Putative Gag-Pol polyprotein n=1 Tax=Tanacetum cinerariifolium TaxID=118510 RepID=A0A6L2PB52_TANCI|nr:putative Gag-Pol polyprotein [Tanacetum cinerariifolium]